MKLDISLGVQEFTLCEGCTVKLNPSDPTFMENVARAFDALDDIEVEYRNKSLAIKEDDYRKVFQLSRERDGKMREIINNIFGQDICSPLFGTMQLTARAEGLPVWANLLLAFMDQMENTFVEDNAKANPRLAKYVEKYQKYQKQKQ